jgi:hypothetical protein
MDMAKVKGYYNIKNKVFLGIMTATNEDTKVSYTPRYIEGVCFGEYDTITLEFVPETNPMIIPTGHIFTQDDAFDPNGNIVTRYSGMVEDKGSDFARKPIFAINKGTVAPPKLIGLDQSKSSLLNINIDKLFR